jgi:integrase
MADYIIERFERTLERVKDELTAEDRELVLKFEQSLASQGVSRARRASYLGTLLRLRKLLGKPFSAVTKEDIQRVLAGLLDSGKSEWTIHDYRVTLKRFYKWLLGNDEEYPELVKWIKTTPKNQNKLPRDSLLSNEEIEQLVQACDNPRDRAIVLVLAESGMRAGELLSLKIGHIRFDQYGAIATVRGKTGDRAVRLIASAPALSTWLENHPFKNDLNAPLWVNIGTKFHGQPMTYRGLMGMLRKLRIRSGIRKRVHPHGFRHTAATRLARVLTEAEMKQYLGWVQSSRMASVYVHLASRDVDKSLLRIHGLISEEEDDEKKLVVIKCPRCGRRNSPGTNFCIGCGLALTLPAAQEADLKRREADELMSKLFEDPEIKGLIKQKLEQMLLVSK